ncbi:MAG: hypothetical protein ACLQMF_04190 [Rectinemataceae bacterium]
MAKPDIVKSDMVKRRRVKPTSRKHQENVKRVTRSNYSEKITFRCRPETVAAIDRYILDSRPGKLTRTDVIDTALQALLNPQDAYWEMVLKRMDREKTSLDRLSVDVELLHEMMNLFLRYYFMQWPDLTPEEKEDSHSLGVRAYRAYKRTLERNITEKGFIFSLLETYKNSSEEGGDAKSE